MPERIHLQTGLTEEQLVTWRGNKSTIVNKHVTLRVGQRFLWIYTDVIKATSHFQRIQWSFGMLVSVKNVRLKCLPPFWYVTCEFLFSESSRDSEVQNVKEVCTASNALWQHDGTEVEIAVESSPGIVLQTDLEGVQLLQRNWIFRWQYSSQDV